MSNRRQPMTHAVYVASCRSRAGQMLREVKVADFLARTYSKAAAMRLLGNAGVQPARRVGEMITNANASDCQFLHNYARAREANGDTLKASDRPWRTVRIVKVCQGPGFLFHAQTD